jgi:CcmD family protein
MDGELEFLFAGFAVFFAAIFVYLLLLQMRLRALQQEVDTLEERLAEYEGTEDGRSSESENAGAGTAAAAPPSSDPSSGA